MERHSNKTYSAKKEAKRLRNLGFNIIPIKANSKVQDGTSEEIADWKKNGCSKEIKDNNNIGIQYSEDTFWAIDFDSPELLKEIIIDEKKRKKLMIVKTSRGHHVIFRTIKGDQPPGDVKLFDAIIDKDFTNKKHSENPTDKNQYTKECKVVREIDIKVHGYTMCPPSIHPDTGKKYEFVNKIFSIPELGWSNASKILGDFGFFKTAEAKSIAHALGNNNDYHELIRGGFNRGLRRTKLRSYYIKLRIYDWKQLSDEEGSELAATKYKKMNQTCIPPLEEKEVKINIASAEKYFLNVVKPELEYGEIKGTIKKKKEVEMVDIAYEMDSKYHFISTISKEIWFYKDDGLYHKHGEDLIRTELEADGLGERVKNSAVARISDATKIRPDEINDTNGNENIFDRDFEKLQVKNKVINMTNGEVLEFSSELRNTVAVNVDFNVSAACPRFEKFLSSITDKNARKTMWILEMFAQCLIKKNVIQRGYVLHGKGQNGKGALLRILVRLLGMENVTTQYMSSFEDNRFLGYDLLGKAASIAADGGTERVERTGKVKSVLGGDLLNCEEKFRSSFTFVPFATLIFTFNELPEVNDHSDGFNRKIQTIHFTKSFYGKNDDPNIETIKDDKTEMSGILNLLLPICKRLLIEKRLLDPFTVEETKKAWTFANDSFYRFSKEEIIISDESSIDGRILRERYEEMCEEWGMEPISQNNFSKRMRKFIKSENPKYKGRIEGETTIIWRGITLRYHNPKEKSIHEYDDDE